ncbi:tRNA (adenosine(37)-N6)-dimethylallyltransferase MiaA [Bacillus sp. FJAT-45350]|uniref:tRNA (adenosine(37)-N6)-dimethylallyltransferase MiaA n=1 Tax=Bacillus sp. FJAT-45350 TaxID=2011014 RepID=UPI000BB704C6|nr:tRNA (adenosine(37)-N6)-dimethylallyltransferase MiaA [Bacillus sp. FJAT-45350]
MKEKLVVIVGPTAVGKTKTGIELAKALHGEVISGDSMQIYKGMDIGTAKVTEEEMEHIPHHLIDIKEPTDSFSAAEFQGLVKPLITELNNKRKIPFIVGGTGLYVKSVTHDYQFPETEADEEYRLELEQYVKEHGVDELHKKLYSIDPTRADAIHPNNYRRVIRALELYRTSEGQIEAPNDEEKPSPYQLVMIGLTMDREVLYNRINKRVDIMVNNGLIEEVSRLYYQGVRNCQSVQAIGYKEIYEYLDGTVSLADAIENLKRNSRRYAKRQLTWFRNKADVEWFDMTGVNFSEKIVEIKQFVEGKLK